MKQTLNQIKKQRQTVRTKERKKENQGTQVK